MNLAKIGRGFAAVVVVVVCFVAHSAFAAMVTTNDFEVEALPASFVPGDINEDASGIEYYNGDTPSVAADYPFNGVGYGEKYLKVDTGDTVLSHTFGTRTSSTYFDAMVKFTTTEEGDAEFETGTKFAIYLDAATSNLCVVSGAAIGDRTAVTNRLVSSPIVPGSWGRLTVNLISDSVFAFEVRLNGALLATAGEPGVSRFYSLTADSTISQVLFSGNGALDNVAVRTTDPYIANEDKAATIGSESYATLEQALEEANGATVALDADHAGTVAVTKSGTYVINKGSYMFGGIDSTDGSYVIFSPSGNVDTYVVKKLVAMWDGAAGAYDFSTLTRTLGDNTYTLNLNSQNTVGGDGSYVQIGPNNAQKGIVLTVQNLNPAVTNGFGTAGAVTVLMKCSDIQSSAANRLLIGILDSGIYGNDNSVKVGLGTRSDWGGAIFEWQGAYHSQINQVIAPDEQTVALTYNSNDGTAFFADGERKALNSGLKSMYFTTPCGISLGGSDSDSGSKFFAMSNMKISAIAVFSSTLTAEEVAAYTFPSETPMSGTVNVSDINALFGTKSEITVRLSDGATVTGDTTFNASTVHFICDGSFTMTAPAGNTATFDFSGVTGKPVFVYNGVTPSVSGGTFTSSSVPTNVTDSTKWTGTVWIKGQAIANFNPSNFGNTDSTLRLSGVSAYFPNQTSPLELNPALELVNDSHGYGLYVNNGFSRDTSNPNRYITFSKLKGDGELWTGGSAPNVLMNVLDWSDFSGKIQLVDKIVVFGSAVPAISEFNTSGSIYIPSDVTVTVPTGKQWRADGGVHVHGTFKATDIGTNQLRDGTSVITYDDGTFVFMTNSDTDDLDVNYSRITGTGTLRYEGTGYRTISRSNFPTNMTVENKLADSGLIHRVPNAELTIGSLSGNGRMRSDWGGTGNTGDRDLRIVQSKDTTYSGLFDAVNDRIRTVYVAPGNTAAGVLTISNAQTASNDLVVESGAKVNITGTWKGATTVAGMLGGTGEVTGNLTLSDGAALKVDDTGDLLAVSGDFTTVAGTVKIYLPAETRKGTKFIDVAGTIAIDPCTKFEVYVGNELKRYLSAKALKDGSGVKITCPPVQIRFLSASPSAAN